MTWGFWIFIFSVAVIVHLAFRFFRGVLRDFFAGLAMASLCRDGFDRRSPDLQINMARLSYEISDAMLKARSE